MAFSKKSKTKKGGELTTMQLIPEFGDRGAKLRYALAELKNASFKMAMICKQIVDEKLYEEAGFDSPSTFFEAATPWIGALMGMKLVQVGDLMAANPQFLVSIETDTGTTQAIGQLISDRRVQEIDREGFVQLSTGDKIPLNEYSEKIRAEADTALRLKNKDAFIAQENEKRKLEEKVGRLEKKAEEDIQPKDDEIKRLKKTLEATTNGKLTADDLVIAANQREALAVAQKAFFDVQSAIKRLCSIDDEFRDPAVTMEVQRIISAIRVGVKGVSENWSAQIYAHDLEQNED